MGQGPVPQQTDYPQWRGFQPTDIPRWFDERFTREHAIELIESVLKGKPKRGPVEWLFPRPPTFKPTMETYGPTYPGQVSAMMQAVEKFPEAASRTNSMTLQRLPPPYDGVYSSTQGLAPSIRLGTYDTRTNRPATHPSVYGTAVHELGHAMGLNDEGRSPTTYDIGSLAELLSKEIWKRDINLPLEKPIMPVQGDPFIRRR